MHKTSTFLYLSESQALNEQRSFLVFTLKLSNKNTVVPLVCDMYGPPFNFQGALKEKGDSNIFELKNTLHSLDFFAGTDDKK